eukprot:TRINITY_DN1878_c0_g1_i1.p2 TRINITY_DN1878_c0_g1~~TRINITY_DN1878_c0_g1_i1.p2  ORF type:complete len:108 (+),score=23.24 TRINITY_DN1878_c0_g1_i1:137-460(+)
MTSKGVVFGLNKGFRVTKIEKRRRNTSNKGKRGPHKALVQDVIREVAGLAPYEKRIQEFVKNGLDKRALRLAKRKLGTHQRAKKKREEIGRIWRAAAIARQKEMAEK